MAWQYEKEEWLQTPEDEERHSAPFRERGNQLVRLWGQYCLSEMELKLRIGYVFDPDNQKRKYAVIGVVINQEPLVDFTCKELSIIIDFLRSTKRQTTKGIPDKFAAEYIESLDGFLDALEKGIQQAQQFEPNNLN